MGSKTNYLQAALLNEVLANVAFTSPTTVYVGLLTSSAGPTGSTASEITTIGTGYVRQVVTFSVSGASPTTAANSGVVTFPTATDDWGIITDFIIIDSLSGGNGLYYGSLGSSRTVLDGDVVSFNIGQLTVTED